MIDIYTSNIYGLSEAVRAVRNPYDSWEKSDTKGLDGETVIGPNDLELMRKLAKAGTDHGKYLRMISVYVTLDAPFYWWKEFDTYKVGTVSNSCSTMHTITNYKFTPEMFSCEDLTEEGMDIFMKTLGHLNDLRDRYNHAVSIGWNEVAKRLWYEIIRLLPSSFMQMRSITMNYAVLRNIYFARRGHKLDEWHQFCSWVETLPYSELIIEV